MFEKILVPTDFTDEADRLLKYVFGLRKWGCREVVLVHVLDSGRSVVWPPPESLLRSVKKNISERKQQLEDKGFTVHTFIREGNPPDEVLRLAEDEQVSLMVVASHGKRLIEELLLGSVSEAVSRRAKVPVLIVRYDVLKEIEKKMSLEEYAKQTFRRVLYPNDFSLASKKAFSFVKKLKKAGTKEVTILHVVNSKKVETEQEKEELFQACNIESQEITNELRQLGFSTKALCRVGDPLQEILKVADEENSSLIVMGSHGKGIVKEWLIGSVSLSIVRTADRPALIARFQGEIG
jgi:nucleotide-binding universal stress UspA family protein